MISDGLSEHNTDAENALLGVMQITPDAIAAAAEHVAASDFYSFRHGQVFACIVRMHEQRLRVDAITIAAEMTGTTLDVNAKWLRDLMANAPATSMASAYASLIASDSRRRSARFALGGAISRLDDGDEAPIVMADLLDGFDAAAATPASSWREIDLEPLWELSAEEVFPAPELLTRVDGANLLAPGATGLVIAPPETAKSMLAMAGVVEAARAGRHSVFVDLESRPRRVQPRLAQHIDGELGRGLFHYIRPRSAMQPSDRWWIRRRMHELRPQLVVIDGYNALLAKHGLDGNKATDIAALAEQVVAPWTADDCCTILIDHVSKDDSKVHGPRMAIGSIAKTGLVDYVISMRVDPEKRIAKGRTGAVFIEIGKDRDGELRGVCRDGMTFGTFAVRSSFAGRWQHAICMPNGMSGPPVAWKSGPQ